MAPIRVLLVDLPTWFRDVINAALGDRTDMVLVDRTATVDLESVVRQSGANVVIAKLVDGVLPPPSSGLLRLSPPVAVIGVGHGEARTVVEMGDVLLEDLLEISRVAGVAAMNWELTGS